MNSSEYLKISNTEYIEELFARYQLDPAAIDASWRYFFDGLQLGAEGARVADAGAAAPESVPTGEEDLSAEQRVLDLINGYRELGKVLADINPLAPSPSSHPMLELSRFGLAEADLERVFLSGKLLGMGPSRLSDIIARLRQTYCGTVAAEFTHILNRPEREWLQERIETSLNRTHLDPATRKLILQRLTESEGFERFLHTRYVAQKRFSLEGGEALIPALDCLIELGAELGAKEFVIGMAHRGRLNVLVNVLKKKPEHVFTEFEGAYQTDTTMGEGDVKYHMGYSADLNTRGGKQVHLSLASNPSHLEFVNAVIEGIARAKQAFLGRENGTFNAEPNRAAVIPIQLHGDAAFAGQGVCYETLNLSRLKGYATGGSLHIVINNQIGFTTSPEDSRSTPYATDVAKMLEAPIFHVNGDDPEAVWHVARLCIEYRQKFGKDAFIDLVCYRRHGHNEGDEPSFTQPLLYKTIKAHPTTRERYARRLIEERVMMEEEAQGLVSELTARLSEAQARTRAEAPKPFVSTLEGRWKRFRRPSDEDLFRSVSTSVPAGKLTELSEKLNHLPEGFHVHPKLNRFFAARLKAVVDGRGLDWGNAEALAFASLLDEGTPVRLSGQDAERGTFTHRHSVLYDFESGKPHTPLNHLREGQAPFHVHNSHLSETGVLGFEYGYALAEPYALTIWEAQFGDFANGAQVIIDQFIATSESKWQRMSGLVLLLPHGFEGQGPEHSSARLERFLQLCGKQNLIVCNFTTPAQYFHALRRQMKRDFRKPLVVMSPKSLLRHPQAVSTLEELSEGRFQEALDDPGLTAADHGQIRKVLLCSGKIYYDLLAERSARKRSDVALIRVEQLYPWPAESLAKVLGQYRGARSLCWVQEEPRNMGAWSFVFAQWQGGTAEAFSQRVGGRPITYLGREAGAAPAVGSSKLHEKEQRAILESAFSEEKSS
ncbi:MAG: 2-oxoglutarate dehydrogenase E1 component [Oligoflexia bacterium]|nr:2-oxoglutarate dehydrogenase E1 component [Oligoflexia bacterium]